MSEELSLEIVRIIASIVTPFVMFGTVVLILRRFKTDTVDMMKIYDEATDAKIEAIREDVRDFHKTLCEIQAGRRYNGVMTEENEGE